MKIKRKRKNLCSLKLRGTIRVRCLKRQVEKSANNLYKNGESHAPQSGATPACNEGIPHEHTPDLALFCIREMAAHGILPKEAAWKLAKRIRTRHDLAARNELVECNTKLVITIAKGYRSCGLPFPDILQEGNLGLMKAAERFDERYRITFPTYAAWWIHQSIRRAIANQTRTIRLPVFVVDRARRIMRFIERALSEEGQDPTPPEIAAALDLPLSFVVRCMNGGFGMMVVSLETLIGADGDTTLKEMVADKQAENPRDETDRHILLERLRCAIDRLDSRSRRVLEMRFGLCDGIRRTLEEVAALPGFACTRERIRQIEAGALRKLRTPSSLRLILGKSDTENIKPWFLSRYGS